MLSHREPKKAQRYLSLLDDARCSANWDEVSRLRLKIAKHLPERKCLQDTAATEYVLGTQFSERPKTSSSPPSFDYGERIPALLTAIKYGNPTAEDAFQAEVCLAWLHWTINEPSLALSRLPSDLTHVQDRLEQTEKTLSGWTHVCIAKGGYLQGICQENTGNLSGAAETYKSMLPYISKAEILSSPLGEHRVWIQRLLARYCLLMHHHLKLQLQSPQERLTSSLPLALTSAIISFRVWAQFWEASSHRPPKVSNFSSDRGDVSQRLVWQSYYDTLSTSIRMQSNIPLSRKGDQTLNRQAAPYDTKIFSEKKSLQCTELKQVQSIYENFLLSELGFPKANEATPEIEIWADQLVHNWKIICGPTWRNEDHLDGGKEATTRLVLEILYRAATKSFHSTRILRHLFIVHVSLAEFELGQKALDSYFDIVVRGKARAEKLKELELGLDDDATAIYTAAMGIKFLCLHGRREEGKRSLALGVWLEEWLEEHHSDLPSSTDQRLDNFPSVSNGEYGANNNRLSPKVLAAGFCALGISQAHWSNLTCEISERAAFQVKALSNFRIAASLQVGDDANPEVFYAFALALARINDVDSAIGVIKKALSSDAINSVDEDFASETKIDGHQLLYAYNRRQALKSWHLLALLLSAKQNFSTAMASCEAALELFGLGSATSDRSQNASTVEDIEFSDRESIIEISMTQLALAEIVDGPEEALNHFRDLLILFGTFFNFSEKAMARDVTVTRVSAPASRNGTIKSFRSNIMGRSGERNRNPPGAKGITRPGFSSFESLPGVIQKTPTISVTTEDSPPDHGTSQSSHLFHHHGSKKLRKSNSKKSINSARRGRAASMSDRPTTTNGAQLNSDLPPAQKNQNYWPPGDKQGLNGQNFTADDVGIAISHDIPPLPRPSTAATIPSSNNNNTTHTPLPNSSIKERSRLLSFPASQPPSSSKIFSPETLPPPPPPFFPSASQKRRSLTLLTKIWLQVAALYRRAKIPTDANDAISEALRQVSAIEGLVALERSSAESFSTPGWGGVPSVSELWADAFSERARLHEFLKEQEEAEADYETALTHFPDHPGAIIGLSKILLEHYSPTSLDDPSSSHTLPPSSPKPTPLLAPNPNSSSEKENVVSSAAKDDDDDDDNEDDTTHLLSRLSARDRATGLLSSLTRSGQGWDCAEAWFALARGYELRGQIDKAKEALWWVVELEETRPVRGWGCLQW